MKDIGVVICNFNKQEYLKACIHSVLDNDIPKTHYDIIVVDNASTDGAPEMVTSLFKNDVILIKNSENLGGSGGFSRGIDYCLENEYEYIVLLDNDTTIKPDTIKNLKEYIDENPDVGVVGAKILQMEHPEILQEIGAFIDWDNYSIKTPYKGYHDNDDFPSVVDCDYVAACCLITTRDVVKQVGNFDVRHFIYWDDMDWCTRIKNSGYKIQAISDATVFHKMGAKNTINTFNSYYFTKNRLFFFLKYLSKEKLNEFAQSISNDFVNLSFFSTMKHQSNNVLSQLWAVEDLQQGIFGKVDNHILDREQVDVFLEKDISHHSKIVLLLNDNSEQSMSVYLFLKKHFTDISVFDENNILNQYETIKKVSFEEMNKIQFDYSFIVVNHLIEINDFEIKFNNQISIDKYQNFEFTEELNALQKSYQIYQNIYQKIYFPMLQEKLTTIYQTLQKK